MELLAALALGSLDENEARRLVVQIESDAELAAEFAEWENVATNIAFAAPPAEPAFELRRNILRAIRQTAQISNSNQNVSKKTENIVTTDAQTKTAVTSQSPQKNTVLNFPAGSKRSFWNFVPAYGAVAASIAAVLLGISLYNVSENNKTKNEQIAQLNQKITVTEQKLADVQTRLEREREERELLASPATFIKALDGTKELPTAKARFVFDPQTGQSLLYVTGLPAPPQGKAYQIWFITDPNKPAPGKTFETDDKGRGVLRDQIPAQHTKASVFAVTLEPVNGSLAPTSSPLLLSTAL